VDDGRVFAALGLLGLLSAKAASGSRGIARAGRAVASNLEPSDDPVDTWPDRYVVPVASDLSLVVARGIPGARFFAQDMEREKWLVADIEYSKSSSEWNAAFEEVCDRVFADIAQKKKRGIGSLITISNVVQRDDSAADMLESDNHAVFRSLHHGLSSIRIPDTLHGRFYRWYLLHPGSGDPSNPNNQRLADLLRSQAALPVGYTIPLQGGHGW